MINKRREQLTLFLEDCFAESHAERLRQSGYPDVQRFITHFGDATRKVEQSVKDPRIIRFCAQRGWLLITPDRNMEKTHCELIAQTQVAILATAHNHADDMKEWVQGLILAKPKIERAFRKAERPWCGTFTRKGEVTIHPISPDVKSRRNRPAEM